MATSDLLLELVHSYGDTGRPMREVVREQPELERFGRTRRAVASRSRRCLLQQQNPRCKCKCNRKGMGEGEGEGESGPALKPGRFGEARWAVAPQPGGLEPCPQEPLETAQLRAALFWRWLAAGGSIAEAEAEGEGKAEGGAGQEEQTQTPALAGSSACSCGPACTCTCTCNSASCIAVFTHSKMVRAAWGVHLLGPGIADLDNGEFVLVQFDGGGAPAVGAAGGGAGGGGRPHARAAASSRL